MLVVVVLSSIIIFVSSLFFFKQKTAYEMRISDWSSDVCSSDLPSCLLIITLSFIPVFTFQAQEGRLFAPLVLPGDFSEEAGVAAAGALRARGDIDGDRKSVV